LTVAHALLSGPDAVYTDLGADYYQTRIHHRRQTANHIRALQRLGYLVTLQPVDGEAA
jgi:hypothetical protein